MNHLKESKTRNFAKNYNLSVIFFSIYRVFYGQTYFDGFSSISMNIRLFSNKYYIKTNKNHWRLNTGQYLTHISHFGELYMDYLSNNGP